jgi:multidrug efflux pump subunit AcrA (membrane-fusion protein)
VQADSSYDIYSSINGIIQKKFVNEGDTVSIGSPLLQIKNINPQLNSDNAKSAFQLAQTNASNKSPILSTIRDEIRNARLKLSSDSLNYMRQKKLWSQNIGSKAELDAKELSYEISQNNLQSLLSKYQRTKEELTLQLNQAKNNYLIASSNSADYTITSLQNGVVYMFNKDEGELVNPQQSIGKIGSSSHFVLEMMIDEVDITKLEIGQEILLNLDAYGKQLFKAKLSKIYPQKDERTQTFRVEGVFVDRPNRLYPGLSGEVNILISRKTQVLTLPNSFLTENNEVQTDDGLVKVEIGLRSMDKSEILSGIDSTTKIYPLN